MLNVPKYCVECNGSAPRILSALLSDPACANPKCFGGQAPDLVAIRIGPSPLF